MVGPRFKGVKMLPPGPHFVSCNATRHGGSGGGGADFAPTVGFFAHVPPRSVVVRRWDPHEELLMPIEDNEEVSTKPCTLFTCAYCCSMDTYTGLFLNHIYALVSIVQGWLVRLRQ